jgi:hypothetical protein
LAVLVPADTKRIERCDGNVGATGFELLLQKYPFGTECSLQFDYLPRIEDVVRVEG